MTTKSATSKGKSQATKQAAQTTPAKKKVKAKAKKKSATGLVLSEINPQERQQMIAEAAYYRAEKRGFTTEGQIEDWLEAESMVDAMLSETAVRH